MNVNTVKVKPSQAGFVMDLLFNRDMEFLTMVKDCNSNYYIVVYKSDEKINVPDK